MEALGPSLIASITLAWVRIMLYMQCPLQQPAPPSSATCSSQPSLQVKKTTFYGPYSIEGISGIMTYPKLERVTTYTWVVGILCGIFCGVIGMLFVVFVVQVKHASEWFSKSFPRKLSYGLLISCISAVIALFFPMTLFWSENEFPYLVRTCLHSNRVRPLLHAPLPGPSTAHASHQTPPPPPPPLPLNMFHC